MVVLFKVTCITGIASALLLFPVAVGNETGSAKAQSTEDSAGATLGRGVSLDGISGDETGSPWWLDRTDPGQDGLQSKGLGATSLPVPADEVGLGKSRAMGLGAMPAPSEVPDAKQAVSHDHETDDHSRAGRIAAYKAGLEALDAAKARLGSAQARLDKMVRPERDVATCRADLKVAREDVQRLQADILRLDQALVAAGGADATIEADLAAAQDDLAEARARRNAHRAQLDEAFDYQDAETEVSDLEATVSASMEEALSLLAAAANKPLSNEVIAEVNRLLGREDVVLVLPAGVGNSD